MNKTEEKTKLKVIVVNETLHKQLHIRAKEQGVPAKLLAEKILKHYLQVA